MTGKKSYRFSRVRRIARLRIGRARRALAAAIKNASGLFAAATKNTSGLSAAATKNAAGLFAAAIKNAAGLLAAAARRGRSVGPGLQSLLRILAKCAFASGRLLAQLGAQAGKAALWLLAGAGKVSGRAIASLPRLLTLAMAAIRALLHFIVYVWQVLVALWALLRPYLRRLLRIVRGHLLASAVTVAGLVAIVFLLDISNPEPVDEKVIPIELRPKVTVAALLSLTGKNAVYAMEMLRGYRIAAEALNEEGITVDGRLSSLELLVYDDESDPNRAGELAERIAQEHEGVRVLLAPYSSLVARPAAAAAARHAIPVLAPAASAAGFDFAPPAGVMLLQTPPAEHLLPALELLFERARESRIDPDRLAIALAWLPDPHSAAVAAGLSAALARRGRPPPRLIDLAAAPEQFERQAAAAAEVDALFVAGYGAGAARIMQQLRSIGDRPPFIVLTHCASGRIGSIAPRMASGALCMRHWQPEARRPGTRPLAERAFVKGYQLRHGRQPTHRAAAAAAAVLVIAEALRKVEQKHAADIHQALAATDLATFYGPIGFNSRGINSRKPMLMSQLQFGKYVPIWPPPAAAGKFSSGGRELTAGK